MTSRRTTARVSRERTGSWHRSCRSFSRSWRTTAKRRRSNGTRPSESSSGCGTNAVTREAGRWSRTRFGPGGSRIKRSSCRCRMRRGRPRSISAATITAGDMLGLLKRKTGDMSDRADWLATIPRTPNLRTVFDKNQLVLVAGSFRASRSQGCRPMERE
jgi:hypothetical protein